MDILDHIREAIGVIDRGIIVDADEIYNSISEEEKIKRAWWLFRHAVDLGKEVVMRCCKQPTPNWVNPPGYENYKMDVIEYKQVHYPDRVTVEANGVLVETLYYKLIRK